MPAGARRHGPFQQFLRIYQSSSRVCRVTIRGARPPIADLGKRHPGYGVTDTHYDSVGAALLWTLEQGLGEAWTAAYALLAGVMRDVANDMTAPTQRAVA